MHKFKIRTTVSILLAALCIAIYLIVSYEKPDRAPVRESGKAESGSPAGLTKLPKKTTPDIVLTGMDHSDYKVFYSDKPTVLLFFVSWCPYCNEDAPKLMKLYEKYKDKVNVYGINVINKDEYKEVAAYIDQHKITYPVLVDKTNEYYDYYGHTGFPSLFFVDRNGEVVDSYIGSTDESDMEDSFEYLIAIDEEGQASLKKTLREESDEDETAAKYLTRLQEDFDEKTAARELKSQMVEVVRAFGKLLKDKDMTELESVIDQMVVERTFYNGLSGREANKALFREAVVERDALLSEAEGEDALAAEAADEAAGKLIKASLSKLMLLDYIKDDSAAEFLYYVSGTDYFVYAQFIKVGDAYLMNEVDVYLPAE